MPFQAPPAERWYHDRLGELHPACRKRADEPIRRLFVRRRPRSPRSPPSPAPGPTCLKALALLDRRYLHEDSPNDRKPAQQQFVAEPPTSRRKATASPRIVCSQRDMAHARTAWLSAGWRENLEFRGNGVRNNRVSARNSAERRDAALLGDAVSEDNPVSSFGAPPRVSEKDVPSEIDVDTLDLGLEALWSINAAPASRNAAAAASCFGFTPGLEQTSFRYSNPNPTRKRRG